MVTANAVDMAEQVADIHVIVGIVVVTITSVVTMVVVVGQATILVVAAIIVLAVNVIATAIDCPNSTCRHLIMRMTMADSIPVVMSLYLDTPVSNVPFQHFQLHFYHDRLIYSSLF